MGVGAALDAGDVIKGERGLCIRCKAVLARIGGYGFAARKRLQIIEIWKFVIERN